MTQRPKVVILGMMSKIPVAGVTWLVGQYAVGLSRLGFDVYYVEAHGRTPSMFMAHDEDTVTNDVTARVVAFIAEQMARFGLADRWAFHALHADGRCYGMSEDALRRLYRDAALIINLHGGTVPLAEHAETGRLVYLGTDPVDLELELHRGEQHAIDFLEPHVAFFTWGLNQGNPDCRLPWSERFPFVHNPPPVVMDLWDDPGLPAGDALTTVGNWRQPWRDVTFDGEVYHWSKHHEFLKVLDLPRRVRQRFELALSSYTDDDRHVLESNGWNVRSALDVSMDVDSYRQYLLGSRGEFTVAKDQNVRLRTGWFSERSATYLAAGRPVITQDTGFGNHLPVGDGLLSFRDLDEASAAVEDLNSDYDRHQRAARAVAQEFLNYDVVLGNLLGHVGLAVAPGRSRRSPAAPELPDALDLTPAGKRPLRLQARTEDVVLGRPVPSADRDGPPNTSIVVVTFDNLAFTRMTLESVLAHTAVPYEIVVVDNGSTDGTSEYLSVLGARNRHVRVVRNAGNRGFAPAANQGIRAAVGEVVVLLNNDTIVTPGWISLLVAHLEERSVGAVGPVTNQCGNAAEIDADYRTHGELLEVARQRAADRGHSTVMPMLVMFCVALRREVLDEVGLLDERFEVGMFEDDDFARRLRAAGYELRCAEDVFVHHFGEASFSKLYADGERSALFDANRRRFEEKWGEPWVPHERRARAGYEALVRTITDTIDAVVPDDAVVAVITKGDDRLLHLGRREARHFPSAPDGTYAGHHPSDDGEAIAQLQRMEHGGLTHLVVPEPSFWWLEHYDGLRDYLTDRYRRVSTGAAIVYERGGSRRGAHEIAGVRP